jgi:hypothetical protein
VDDFLEAGASNDLFAEPIGWLSRGPDDGMPLALETPQEHVRHPAHEDAVIRLGRLWRL